MRRPATAQRDRGTGTAGTAGSADVASAAVRGSRCATTAPRPPTRAGVPGAGAAREGDGAQAGPAAPAAVGTPPSDRRGGPTAPGPVRRAGRSPVPPPTPGTRRHGNLRKQSSTSPASPDRNADIPVKPDGTTPPLTSLATSPLVRIPDTASSRSPVPSVNARSLRSAI